MDADSSHAAANMACVLNFVKKMLAIVSLVPPASFPTFCMAHVVYLTDRYRVCQ